jgi:hypothetical protein
MKYVPYHGDDFLNRRPNWMRRCWRAIMRWLDSAGPRGPVEPMGWQ